MTTQTHNARDKRRRRLRIAGLLLAGFVVGYLFRWAVSPAIVAQEGDQQVQDANTAQDKVIWTCAMHPEVRLDKPGLCPKCNMKLIPVTVGAAGQDVAARTLVVSDAAKALMDIETSLVERKAVTHHVRMVGKVDYDETRVGYVTAWAGGRIDRMFVAFTGQQVTKGDAMVALYSPAIINAQEELLQAKASAEHTTQASGLVAQMGRSAVEAAREKLRLLGLTAEQIASIEKDGPTGDDVTIHSPIAGIVVHKSGLEGMYVKPGTQIYTVADLSSLWVRMEAYESDLPWLKEGDLVEFTTVSVPDRSFTGRVSFIDPTLDQMTRTARVRVVVDNADGMLKPEMFVRAVAGVHIGAASKDKAQVKWTCPMHPQIMADREGLCPICNMRLVQTTVEPKEGLPLVIPASAPLLTGKRAVVYVALSGKGKPTFEGREVVLGPKAGDYYVVTSGLREGERVVTNGAFKIDSELQIQAKPSMMAPEAATTAPARRHTGGMTHE